MNNEPKTYRAHTENDFSESWDFQTTWAFDPLLFDYFIEDAAEADYDGGDLHDPDDWPRTYYIWTEEGEYICEGSVNMEYSPHFSGSAEIAGEVEKNA